MPERRCIHASLVHAGSAGAIFDVQLSLPEGATVADAIAASGFRAACPDVAIGDGCIGIFACKVAPGTVLRDGDRVEIYRPLKVDPKEARRRRAKKQP
ncbi:MAG: RnfH family protein [Rhodanobacteraceae bacterium]